MRFIPTLLALLCTTLLLHAQFETDYIPLTSQGTLPQDFVTLSADKYEAEKSKLSKSEKRSERKSKEKFLLQTNFGLDEMLLSGKILFNDPASAYVSKVADNALASEPALRSQLRFYVLKSTAVNAFATNQGVICVTMGLLAQIENEAQLAFIICHEATHFKEKHSIERYLEADKIERGRGAYKKMAFDEMLIQKCAFSKEQEKEADNKGIEIYLKSNYSTTNLMGIYDVLKYAYLPFDDITFEKEFLENTYLKLPANYTLKETKEINTAEIDDEDEKSTHPSLKIRRKQTEEAIAGADNRGKKDCLTSQEEFNKIRELSRFELCRLYTLRRNYETGLYTSYMLLKRYPENLYLKKNVAFCLAGLAEYNGKGRFSDVHGNYLSVEGKSQDITYLIYKLDSIPGDLCIVSVAYITKLKKQYPDDKEIDELFNNQMLLLVDHHSMGYSSFSKFPPTPVQLIDSIVANTKETPKDDELKKSKYEKLREMEAETKVPTVVSGGRFTKFAFVEFMNEPWFKQAFEDARAKGKKARKAMSTEENTYQTRRYYNTVYAMGIKKIVVVDPYYARINNLSKDKYKYIKSEAGQVDFAERIKTNAKMAKLEAEVLNTKNLKSDETGKFNDLALMEEYISDRLHHSEDVDLPFAERNRINELAKKYDTDYFMWTGTISLTDKNRYLKGLTVLSVLLPFTLPLTMPKLIHGGQYTVFFALLY
ncbi:MAG TPA: M48 family metallopeptidase, partial [Chitinophagales bacterium]|nr:M48 family metallopeptidase [Chitinophagales bacterium]